MVIPMSNFAELGGLVAQLHGPLGPFPYRVKKVASAYRRGWHECGIIEIGGPAMRCDPRDW